MIVQIGTYMYSTRETAFSAKTGPLFEHRAAIDLNGSKVRTTHITGGLHSPYKGVIMAAPRETNPLTFPV